MNVNFRSSRFLISPLPFIFTKPIYYVVLLYGSLLLCFYYFLFLADVEFLIILDE